MKSIAITPEISGGIDGSNVSSNDSRNSHQLDQRRRSCKGQFGTPLLRLAWRGDVAVALDLEGGYARSDGDHRLLRVCTRWG